MILDRWDAASGAAAGRTYMDAPEVDCEVRVPKGVRARDVFRRVRISRAEAYDLEAETVD